MFLSVNCPPRREDYIFKNIVYYAFLTIKITTMSGAQTRWQGAGSMGSHYTHKWKFERKKKTENMAGVLTWGSSVFHGLGGAGSRPDHYRCHSCYHYPSIGLFKQPWNGSMTGNSVSGEVLQEPGAGRRERLSLLWHHGKQSAWPFLSTHCVQGLFWKYYAWGATHPWPFRKTQQKVTEAPIYSKREGLEKERAQMFL